MRDRDTCLVQPDLRCEHRAVDVTASMTLSGLILVALVLWALYWVVRLAVRHALQDQALGRTVREVADEGTRPESPTP